MLYVSVCLKYVYICMHACMTVYMHMHACMYVCENLHNAVLQRILPLCVYMYVCICMSVCMYMYVCVKDLATECMHVCMYVYA